ncbi:MAG: nucleotidyltransferase [Proteobacteria bacterium]|nr:nucleotidyltransferase [Pseudomonadota bacterium]
MIYPDFLELLRVFAKHKVAYAVIGGYAVGIHAEPRYTKDLDILIVPEKKNAKALLAALSEFGAPISNLSVDELATPGLLYVFGIPPLRVDILNRIVGANVKALIKRAKKIKIADTSLKVVAIADLIMLKKLAGRKQDLADIEKLKAVKQLKR